MLLTLWLIPAWLTVLCKSLGKCHHDSETKRVTLI